MFSIDICPINQPMTAIRVRKQRKDDDYHRTSPLLRSTVLAAESLAGRSGASFQGAGSLVGEHGMRVHEYSQPSV